MKIRKSSSGGPEKVELNMTPMIDVVFQLLIFFILSFKIVVQEGDFNIKMPLAAAGASNPDDIPLPPIKVRLAAADGGGVQILVNGEPMASFAALHNKIMSFVSTAGPGEGSEDLEVELDCDYALPYVHVVSAITEISGYVDPSSGQVVKLIEKIKFAPPRQPAGE